ncbi:MAG TPA: ISAs1 family transposase [Caulobacteraceae bacterium]
MPFASEPEFAPSRLAALLRHFAEIDDDRETWRVAYPLKEVLLLVTCATIANCDDFEAIVAWGERHLLFLRRFSDFHHGVPCARWLRDLMNRIDPILFARCFEAFVASMWPGKHDFIAIDGKTARRTHDKRKGLKALHTLSAYATNARLTLAQRSVPEKTNEITAIPDLLDTLAEAGQLEGAVVSIDAMGCQIAIAQKILDHRAHYVLSLKANQPTLETDIVEYLRSAPPAEVRDATTLEKAHGRIETRRYVASANVDWIASDRRYPGEPRFPGIATLIQVHSTTEQADKITHETRTYISSLPLDIDRIAAAIRGHWGVESMHWLLDVQFKDDLSRYRQGHSAKNMAVVRRFALDLVRANKTKGSVKTRRLIATWDTEILMQMLSL